jgi:L-threonylcarbamoyladenylate synthase
VIILKANKNNFIFLLEKSQQLNEPIIFPTDTIYGIGALINNIKANKHIYEIKGRSDDKPFPILIGELKQLEILTSKIEDFQMNFINKLWPGPYTLIFNANTKVNTIFTMNGKIAVRFPSSQWICEALCYVNSPITATSANLSNTQYSNNFKEILGTFKDKIRFVLYSDSNQEYHASTIIDISEKNSVKFIRNSHNLLLTQLIGK